MADDDRVYGELSHGFASEPMFPKPEPDPAPDPVSDENDNVSVEAMASELADKWRKQGLEASSEAPLIDRGYKKPDGSPVEPDRIVTLRENAEALGRAYEKDTAQRQQLENESLAAEIDQVRVEQNIANNPEWTAQLQQLEAQQQAQQQPQETQQPEPQQPADPGDELAAAWQATDPKIRQALEAQVQQVQAAQAAYVEAAQGQARLVARSLFSDFPELQNCSPEQMQAVINSHAQRDPQRAMAIQLRVQDALVMADAAQRATVQQHQRHQETSKAQWKQYVDTEDKRFLEMHPELADMKARMPMAEAVVKTAEAAGISKENLMKSYAGELKFDTRSAAVQEIMLKAALYDQAKANIAHADKPNVPPVQRPGTFRGFSGDGDENIAALTARANKTGALKDVTALRLAKLRARG